MATTADPQTPARPAKPTLDSLSPSQIEAIRRIPPHDGGQKPTPIADWLEPVIKKTRPASIFLDRERFDLEQRSIFRRLPVPLMPSARLPEPGDAVAFDGYGPALIVARDKDGVVRTFHNACQHKGSKLIEQCEVHKAARFICPYHSWTYGLDGRLLAAARSEMFTDFDKADYKLSQLPTREYAGMIWGVLDPEVTPDWSAMEPEGAGGFADDMRHLGIPNAYLYGHKRFEIAANWKLVLEPFMESYHVTRLHASSIGDLFTDMASICTKLGPHQRKVAGKIQFQPSDLDIPGENIHKTVTHAYQVFPNGTIVTSPYYISMMVLMPIAPDKTNVDYYMLLPRKPDSEKAESIAARSYELILKVFGGEDFRAATITQEGLASGGLKTVTYGGMENTIPTYYDQLESHFLTNERG